MTHAMTELETLRARVAEMERERDEARTAVEHAYREGGALYEAKIAQAEAEAERDEARKELEALRRQDEYLTTTPLYSRRKLMAERDQAEASAAAMREALRLQASTHDQGHSPCFCVESRAALASEAGRELLEELARLRLACEAADGCIEHGGACTTRLGKTCDCGAEQIQGQIDAALARSKGTTK